MGLDWKPMNKPHKGREEEYKRLFKLLTGEVKQSISFFDKLKGKKEYSRDELLDQFLSISSTAYETLNAPQVGIHEEATKWAESKYEHREDKSLSLDEFITQMKGYYVVDLVSECEGVPVYIALHDEAHIFRAQFLIDCEEILGPNLFERAYESKLSEETLEYANELMACADQYALSNNCMYLKEQRRPPEVDEDSPEAKAHILFSAAKWLQFWSTRGHGMEADF